MPNQQGAVSPGHYRPRRRPALPSSFEPDRFSDLPPDLLWNIISYLSLRDVFLVRQLSKWLCTITEDSTVWMSLFNRRLRDLESPLLCLRGNDLTARDIEKIACGYPRFLSLARKWTRTDIGKETPIPQKLVAFVSSIPEIAAVRETISSLRLLPGGRLLLLTSVSLIQLWDLGITVPQAKCIASCKRVSTPREDRGETKEQRQKATRVSIFQVRVVDGKLRICLTLSNERGKGTYHSALLYTIDPEAKNPTFECIGRFSSFAPITDMCGFVGNKILFSFKDSENQRHIGVHYWKEDITFQWYAGTSVYDVDFLEEANLIITITHSLCECDYFKCPNLSQYPTAVRGEIYTIENKGLYFWSWKDRAQAFGDWTAINHVLLGPVAGAAYNSSLSSKWESIILLKNEQAVVLLDQSWVLKYPSGEGSWKDPWWAPDVTRTIKLPTSQFQVGRHDTPYSLSMDGCRVLWWDDFETQSLIRFFILDDTTKLEDSHGLLEKAVIKSGEKTGPFYWRWWSFSPIMGRAVFADDERKGFRVVEYNV